MLLRPCRSFDPLLCALAVGLAWVVLPASATDLALQPSWALRESLSSGGGPRSQSGFVRGDAIEGQTDVYTTVQGHAELRQPGLVLKAEQIHHDLTSDTVDASGDVQINRMGNRYQGPALHLQLERQEGYFLEPRFSFLKQNGQGQARRMDFLGPDQSQAQDAMYSTCPRPDAGTWQPDWWITAPQIGFDTATDTGTAHQGTLYFKGVPLLAAPYVEFPLSNARRSGFLPPTLNLSNKNGLDIGLPYYVHLRPQEDLTLTPNLMTARGLNLGSEWRYLDRHYSGEWNGAYMGQDRLRERARWGLFAQHRQDLGNAFDMAPGLNLRLNLNQVSDNDYWRDFPAANKVLAQRLLPNEAVLGWHQGDWSWNAGSYTWQTLQDPTAPILPPYDRVPSVAARQQTQTLRLWPQSDWEWNQYAEWTRFNTTRPASAAMGGQATVRNGERAVWIGQIGKTWETPAWFVQPSVQLHLRQYQFEQALAEPQPWGLAVPSLRIDTGWFFERDLSTKGGAYTQTLEPRLVYTHTPYRPQNGLPNYDSGPFDFDVYTAYQGNPYVGNDRIADLKAVTLGASSRWIHQTTGHELFNLAIAQRYRLQDQQVRLPGEAPVTAGWSNLLLGGRWQQDRHWSVNSTLQYDTENHRFGRRTLSSRYTPGPYQVLNLGYRFKEQTTVNNSSLVDLSWQWPLFAASASEAAKGGRGFGAERWYSVGRLNYSIPDQQMVNVLAGLEYDAGCWIGRVVLERLQSSSNATANQRVMFQLEFSDFSRIGASPLPTLRNNIPRYQYLREEINPPSRFERYE